MGPALRHILQSVLCTVCRAAQGGVSKELPAPRPHYVVRGGGSIYNFCANAHSTLGYIHTAVTKAAISVALSGHIVSEATKAAISTALLGNTNGLGNTNHLGHSHTAESIDQIR